VKVRLFIVLLVVVFLFGYLTFRNKQIGDARVDFEFPADIRATVNTVMSEEHKISIWRHGDRIAYGAGGGVGLVAPRGKGQRIYTANNGQFVSGSLSHVLTRDGDGIRVHTRRGSFLLPNSGGKAGEVTSFAHIWSNGLLYYTLSTGGEAAESFLGLFAYNPETQTNEELMAAQNGHRATDLVLSPAKTQLMLVLGSTLRPGKSTEQSGVWVYDLHTQKSERVEVLPHDSDEPGRLKLSGPLVWASENTIAIGLRLSTDDSIVGTAVYNYTDRQLRLKRVFPSTLQVLTVIRENNLLVLTELIGIAGDGTFIESQLWLYDPATDELTALPNPPHRAKVERAVFHETSGNLFILRQTRQEGEESNQTMGSFVDASGSETPLFTARGTITEAVWIGYTLYTVIREPEGGYSLKRITFPRQ